MNFISCFLIYLLPLWLNPSIDSAEKSTLNKVKKASSLLAKAMESEDLKQVLAYNIPTTMILPEYQNALESPTEIQDYYNQFFLLTETNYFKKTIIEIQQFDEYFMEIGTFQHDYKTTSSEWFSYKGKYMSWWTQGRKGKIKLVGNIWGASSYPDDQYLRFLSIETKPTKPVIPNTPIEKLVMKNIAFAKAAVQAGDFEKQLTTYLDDAIYMTYYDPPFIGKKAISKYFSSHYDPNVTRDSLAIHPYRVIDLKDHVLTLGKYYVTWTYENQKSFIHGKGFSLYKKVQDDQLKIYRQMINHSIPPTPFPSN